MKINANDFCFPIPDSLSDEQAATSYVNPMTAWLMLTELLQQLPHPRIAINAANSSIGLMLIRLARVLNIETVAIVRREGLEQLFSSATPDTLIVIDNYHDNTILKTLNVNAVFDCIGGEAALAFKDAVQYGGQYICYRLLSQKPIPASFWLTRPDIQFSYFHLRQWIYSSDKKTITHKLNEIFNFIQQGIIEANISAIFPLTEIATDLQFIADTHHHGKVLIRC